MQHRIDCHDSRVVETRGGKRWVSIRQPVPRTVFHCDVCGSKLYFDSDGNPVVGASYDELEKKAGAIDRLDTNASCHLIKEAAELVSLDWIQYYGNSGRRQGQSFWTEVAMRLPDEETDHPETGV